MTPARQKTKRRGRIKKRSPNLHRILKESSGEYEAREREREREREFIVASLSILFYSLTLTLGPLNSKVRSEEETFSTELCL